MQKLIEIQNELKAPKGKTNSFGGYKYRSCEDILEAVKPLCKEHGCLLTLSDEIISEAGRVYVKTTATITDGETEVSVSASAREAENKKGMDDSQITGATSSYARKYALNGLFCIDDTKDADTDEYVANQKVEEAKPITQFQVDELAHLCDKAHRDIAKMCTYYKVKELSELTQAQYEEAKRLLKK